MVKFVSRFGWLGWIGVGVLASLLAAAKPAAEPGMSKALTATDIVAKSVAARGGLEAWRKVETMRWMGHVETGNPAAPSLPFVMELARPNKTRMEIHVEDQQSVRVFDGAQGWKLTGSHSRQTTVTPYGADELQSARDWHGMQGFLIDYEANGISVGLEGIDRVENHPAYRLSVTLPSGKTRRVWVDAKTFLEIRYDHETRNKDGTTVTVPVYLRNYAAIDGLQIPMLIETGSGSGQQPNQLIISKVELNPKLDARAFVRPRGPSPRNIPKMPSGFSSKVHVVPPSQDAAPAPAAAPASPPAAPAQPAPDPGR